MTSSPRLSPIPRSWLLSISTSGASSSCTEPEAGLNAGDALVLAERHGHVLNGAQLELESPVRSPHQLRQPCPVALDDRQADHLNLAPGSPRIDRHLEVGPVPGSERAGDDRQIARVAAEMIMQAPPYC